MAMTFVAQKPVMAMPKVMAVFGIALLAAALPAQVFRPPREADPDWVVRSVFPAELMPNGDVLRWVNRNGLGDVDRDGCTDFTLYGEYYPSYFMWPLTAVQGGSLDQTVFGGSFSFFNPNSAVLLNSGNGLQAVLDVGRLSLEVWSVPGLQYLGDILRPPPPTGKPKIRVFESFSPGADLNGDGADELLYVATASHWIGYTQKYKVFGAIDGITYQALWQQYIPNLSLSLKTPALLSPTLTDLNGDGTPDWFVSAANSAASHNYYYALSGVDGSVLWTFDEGLSTSGAIDRYINPSPDLNGDGIRDLLVLQPHFGAPISPFGPDPGVLYAISGVDGTLIWENRSIGLLDRNYGTYLSEGSMRYWDAAPLGDLDRDGFPEIMIIASEVGFRWHRTRFLIFRGADGTLLDREAVPETLAPYFPRDYLWDLSWKFLTLGDVDRDGYLECLFFPNSRTVVHSNGIPGIHAAIVGRRTLKADAEVHLGETLVYDIDLPNAQGCLYHALFSTNLDWNGGGYLTDQWDTFLGPSPALTWSLANSALTGTLGPLGFGSLGIGIPSSPVLVGRSIFARVWAEEPGQPGTIRTMTSLAITEIQP